MHNLRPAAAAGDGEGRGVPRSDADAGLVHALLAQLANFNLDKLEHDALTGKWTATFAPPPAGSQQRA